MIAVCFHCGSSKFEPLAKCRSCRFEPVRREAQIASLALSRECLSEKHLKIGSAYIKKTGRIPKFHKAVQHKAAQLVDALVEVPSSDSIELSSSFFDFEFSKPDGQETVTVHSIGKPEHLDDDYRGQGSHSQTYHTVEWEIGKQVSADQVESCKDLNGDIFIWYRWMGNRWTWKCVTRIEFEQLRSVEN